MIDKFPFEIPSENPIEKAKRITNSKLSELYGDDLKCRLEYEEMKNRKFDDWRNFKGDLRTHLYDFGYNIQTEEMKRDFYLKNRLSKIERKNMLNIFEMIEKSALKDKLCFGYAIFGVGSSTYSDEYYSKLEKSLLENGINRDDFLTEETWHHGDQFSDFKNYEEYFEKYTRENKGRPFDEQLLISSKENFYEFKKREQQAYKEKKKFGEVLDRKGEDLDFVICPDGWLDFDVSNYGKKKMNEFRKNFGDFLVKETYSFIFETSYLAGHNYRIFDGVLSRSKEIDRVRDTCRISFSEGRNFHFYFDDRFSANEKLMMERIENSSFVQLIRRNNFEDLRDTIVYGEQTGVYENPKILKFLGRI